MKKLFGLVLVLALVLSMCVVATAEEDNWKIAILTGTTTQGEEEYYAAKAKNSVRLRMPRQSTAITSSPIPIPILSWLKWKPPYPSWLHSALTPM